MNRKSHLLPIAAALLGACLATAAQAQTPLPKVPPNLTIKWLNTLTISPTSAAAGTSFTGTVKLMRPAVSDLRTHMTLTGGRLDESGVWILDGVVVPVYVTVPAGKDRATFTAMTSNSVSWIGSRTFTVTANYAKESVPASFTVSRIGSR